MVKDMKVKSTDPEERKSLHVKVAFICAFILLIVWASFTVYEYNRVSNNKDTLVCLHKVKENETADTYSVTCYGLFYKYRKYYYINSNKISAREFTMIFNEFKGE